jgi:sugar diacid utilization regulator
MSNTAAQLNRILGITRAMITVLDPDLMLRILVDMMREFDGVVAASVYEYDETSGRLRIRCSAGLSEEYVRTVSVPIGQQAVGRAFQRRDLVLISDVDLDPTFAPILSQTHWHDIHSILGAPLVARDKLLGILTVYFPKPMPVSAYDTGIIRTVANLAALAIDNAQLFQSQIRANRESRELCLKLEEQGEILKQTLEIHEWLIKTVILGNGLDSVSNALMEFAKAAIVIEDTNLSILCSAHPSRVSGGQPAGTPVDLGLAPFAKEPRVREQLARIVAERRPEVLVPIPEIGLVTRRITTPVFAGDNLLAFVSIISPEREFGKLDFLLAAQASVAIALELTKGKVAVEAEQRIRGQFLQQLLAGQFENPEEASAALGVAKFDLKALHTALIIRFDRPRGSGQAGATFSKTPSLFYQSLALVERQVLSRYSKSAVVATGESITVLLGSEQRPPDSSVRELAEHLVRRLGELLTPETVTIGIGGICEHLKDLPRSFVEATKALEVATVLDKRNAVLTLSELGVYGIILRQSDSRELREFVRRFIGPVVDYDRARQSGLVQTFAAYVENDYSLEATARALSMHVNTVKYRLRRIEELSGVNLHDSQGLMNVQLALRLHELTTDNS